MDKQRSLSLRFPVGGVVRRAAFEAQAPFTTPDALNVWPTQWESGRERGGSRPGLTATGGNLGNTPYNWCTATWAVTGGGVRREIAVTHAGGTSVSNGAGVWSTHISTAPGSPISSCAVFDGYLFQARSGGTLLHNKLTNSAGAGSTITPDAGTVPTKCGLVVAWGDRLILAGNYDDPYGVYGSRVGVNGWKDWDYSAVDQSAAWSLTGPEGGLISDPVTSLIPHNRDCLLIGCTDSLYVLRGSPTAGGQAYVLSYEVGPLTQSAWCRTGNDYVMMLTRDGLYSMAPGCGDPPVSVSREKLPAELSSITPESNDHVALGYDHRWRGIHIYVAPNSGSPSYWFYDLQSGGFWPMSFGVGLRLCPSLRRAATSTKSAILPIASTGALYQFDVDSTESFQSYYVVGPVKLGGAHGSGNVMELRAVLAEDSDPVSWGIRTGMSPQEAYAAPESFTGRDWSVPGLNPAQHPRVGGNAAYVMLEGSGSQRISVDELTMLTRETGRRR
jgi:hypothetical protein